jgi:Mobilization protein NikA
VASSPDAGIGMKWRMGNRSSLRVSAIMLHSMQEQVTGAPSLSTASFASLLAALATPGPAEPMRRGGVDRAAAWDGDGLADDIATLSYEQALRTHARHRGSSGDLLCEDLDGEMQPGAAKAVSAARAEARNPAKPLRGRDRSVAAEPRAAQRAKSVLEARRKSASITIRLSSAECAQLHERAAEAGITKSAYLRSCAFEVEALRAQVKDVVAQLRSGERAEKKKPAEAAPTAAPGWRARLFTRWKSRQSIAGA